MNALTNFINDFKIWINDVKKSDKKLKMIIPNTLTASRILAPFCILPTVLLGNFTLATIFAITFATTDAFDGFLARKWNATSEFGKNLDPIVDKFFVLGIILPFLNNNAMIATLIFEGIIGTINLKSAFKNNKPKSTILGKGKTVLLSLFISLSYLLKMKGIPLKTLFPLALTTNIVQLATAINYLEIDNKKDIVKEVKKVIKENNDEQKENNNEQNKKANIHQELIEFRHLKDSLLSDKEEVKTYNDEDSKKRHFKLKCTQCQGLNKKERV